HSGAPPPPIRAKAPSVPPPPPPPKAAATPPAQRSAKAPSATPPPTGPRFPRAGYDGPSSPFATEMKSFAAERTPPVIIDVEALGQPAGNPPTATASGTTTSRPVPVGEFDSGARTLDARTNEKPEAPSEEAAEPLDIPDVVTPV